MSYKSISLASILCLALLLPAVSSAATSDYRIDELNRNLRSIQRDLQSARSLRAFRGLSDARRKTIDLLRQKGIDAFLPLNEGKIRAGTETKPQCPSKASTTLGFCTCTKGYKFDGLNKCVAMKVESGLTMTERKKLFDEFLKKGNECPDYVIPSEYPATKFMCEVVNPNR